MFGFVLAVFFVLAVVLGAPMAVSFLAAGLVPVFSGTDAYSLQELVGWLIDGNKNIYLAIAFFVVSGNIMTKGNISSKIYELFAFFLGDRNGFLPICALLTAVFYGMVSGSAIAVTAAVGSLCLPILVRVGYDKEYYAALLCTAGCLGMIIPPSSVVISGTGLINADPAISYRYAMVIGLACMLVLMISSLIYTRKNQGNHEIIMKEFQERRAKGLKKVFTESIWALMIPVIILGTIFSNILTANEAAAVSVLYCAFISVYIYKTLTWREVWDVIVNSIKSIAPLAVTLMSAIAFGSVITATGANEAVAAMVSNVDIGQSGFMLLNVVVFSVTGFFMNVMYIVMPILLPVAQSVGVNLELWCAVVAALGSLALLTPPFGYGLMIMAPMANISLGKIFKKVLPLWLLLTLLTTVLALFPVLTSWVV